MGSVKSFLDGHRVAIVSIIAVGGVAYCLAKWTRRDQRKNEFPLQWEEVGVVSQLYIYPVKSARAISVKSANATKLGLASGYMEDRSFMIVTEDGAMITGRHIQKLVTMETTLVNDILTLGFQGADKTTVNISDVINRNKEVGKVKIRGDHVMGVDCGEEVAAWLTGRLSEEGGTKLRLVYAGQSRWQRAPKTFAYYKFEHFGKEDSTLYMDTSSYHVSTESSLQHLNERISRPVSHAHFRPSIVVRGCPAFDEDDWSFLRIGEEVVLHVAKPCERCKLTTVDPETGDITKEHFDEMLKYRLIKDPAPLAKQWKNSPIFGIHCGIDATGKVKMGDKVFVSRFKSPPWRV